MREVRSLLILVGCVLVACNAAFAAVYFVNGETGDDANPGYSHVQPWKTVGHGLTAAVATAQDPAIIYVAAGTYSASTNGETFPLEMRSYISLIGTGDQVTFIDAEAAASHVFHCSSVEHATISALTIRGGKADGSLGAGLGGGGVRCESGSQLVIQNCVIAENEGVDGAGILCLDSSLSLIGCTVADNTVRGVPESFGVCRGGGIMCLDSLLTIDVCVIIANSAYAGEGEGALASGGGMYLIRSAASPLGTPGAIDDGLQQPVVIRDTQIGYNTCPDETSSGGGIYASGLALELQGCFIAENTAFSGGGIYWLDSRPASTPGEDDNEGLLQDCWVMDNTAEFGGGLCLTNASPLFKNCLFTNNISFAGGGAMGLIAFAGTCAPRLVNCTTARNSAGSMRGASIGSYSATPEVINSILGDDFPISAYAGGEPAVTFSCVNGGYEGEGNIPDMPLFATGPLGDRYLACVEAGQVLNSPCIDAGSDTAESLGLAELTTRTDSVLDTGTVDMGYHYPALKMSLECSLNSDRFVAGDRLAATYTAENPARDVTVDFYSAFVMPDGTIVCITPLGFEVGILPWVTDLFIPQGFTFGPQVLFEINVPYGIASGDYLFASALSTPGQFEIIGDLSIFRFTLAD